MIQVFTGTPSPIFLKLYDESSNKYPRAVVRKSDETPVATVDLTHELLGRYTAAVTFPSNGYYYVDFTIYSDPARTIISPDYNSKTDFYLAEPTGTLTPEDIAAIVLAASSANQDLDMTTAIDSTTDTIEFLVWTDIAGGTSETPLTAALSVFDGAGTLIHAFPLNSSPNAQGVFKFTKTPVTGLILRNKTYVTSITINSGSGTQQKLRSFTVF